MLLHGGLRNSCIWLVAGLANNGCGSSLAGGKEIGILDGVCPSMVSTRAADDSHDEDDNSVDKDYRICHLNSGTK